MTVPRVPAPPPTQVIPQHRGLRGNASASPCLKAVASANLVGEPRSSQRRKSLLTKTCERYFYSQPSWATSVCFHICILLVFALIMTPDESSRQLSLELRLADGETELDDFSFLTAGLPDMPETEPELVPAELEMLDVASSEVPLEYLEVPTLESLTASRNPIGGPQPHAEGTPGGIAGRLGRRAGAQGRGASPGSEAAVDRALRWLARHQDSEGSWNFDLRKSRCQGKCRDSGNGHLATNGATALAVLPFLGAGNTTQKGEYRDHIRDALDYLVSHQARDGGFLEAHGTMYSHGLAALALCEAVALENAESHQSAGPQPKTELHKAAQRAIDFIAHTQGQDGGWRYQRYQRGDTSVVGWQAMALQSGRLAGLRVPERTLAGVTEFLNSVQADAYGATYGYEDSSERPGTTAVGLLCRMYLGWNRNSAGIINGAERLSKLGPSSNNIYYDYYATQVMHHYEGALWERWNATLRDHLVRTQVKTGHSAGSWYFEDDFGSGVGGRLYITAMAAMTLEVYYRHMPIYSQQAVGQQAEL